MLKRHPDPHEERREDDENLKRASTCRRLQQSCDQERTSDVHKALRARPSIHPASCWKPGWRNAERVSPGDESGRAIRKGNALKRKNPKSVSGMKQGRTIAEDETLKGLRKAAGGWRSVWKPDNEPTQQSLYAEGAQNPMGGAPTRGPRLATERCPDGSLKES